LVPLPLTKALEIDFDGVRENIDFLTDSGVHGVIALGSMGEFFQVSSEEFRRVVDTVTDAASGKLACTIGCSYQNSAESVRRTRYAEDAGADGAMIMVPYYLPLTPEEAFEHYRIIDESVEEIQIMVYNFPPASRVNITPELWERLVTLNSIKAVKESNSDIFHVTRLLSRFKSRISVLAGSEAWLLPESLLGARGVTSIFGVGLPELVLEFYNACGGHDFDKAITMHNSFVEASWFINPYNEVAWLKALAELCGRKAGPPMPPYSALGEVERDLLRRWLERTKVERVMSLPKRVE